MASVYSQAGSDKPSWPYDPDISVSSDLPSDPGAAIDAYRAAVDGLEAESSARKDALIAARAKADEALTALPGLRRRIEAELRGSLESVFREARARLETGISGRLASLRDEEAAADDPLVADYLSRAAAFEEAYAAKIVRDFSFSSAAWAEPPGPAPSRPGPEAAPRPEDWVAAMERKRNIIALGGSRATDARSALRSMVDRARRELPALAAAHHHAAFLADDPLEAWAAADQALRLEPDSKLYRAEARRLLAPVLRGLERAIDSGDTDFPAAAAASGAALALRRDGPRDPYRLALERSPKVLGAMLGATGAEASLGIARAFVGDALRAGDAEAVAALGAHGVDLAALRAEAARRAERSKAWELPALVAGGLGLAIGLPGLGMAAYGGIGGLLDYRRYLAASNYVDAVKARHDAEAKSLWTFIGGAASTFLLPALIGVPGAISAARDRGEVATIDEALRLEEAFK